MSQRSTHDGVAEFESSLSRAGAAMQLLRQRLAGATREQLAALVERLASDSDELAARIDFLTNPAAATKALRQRIATIRRGKRFIAYGESGQVAAELATIAADIRADVLAHDPHQATSLAESLFSLDRVIFERADDSNGSIGFELRAACVLWLDAAAVVRTTRSGSSTDWSAVLYDYYKANDYGVREPLLEQAHRLLREEELRALAAQFAADSQRIMEAARSGEAERHTVFASSSAMGLVARALRDPQLYEQSILLHSPEPNGLQANDIAKQYLDCGDGVGASRWLEASREEPTNYERHGLMDRAYELTGNRDRQIELRKAAYQRSPGIHSYKALSELLPDQERAAFRARACQDAETGASVAMAAELLFALDEPAAAEQLIVERAAELDGRSYWSLTELVNTAQVISRSLAAVLIWRAQIDAILERGYAKGYGHAARYLVELRELSAGIEDYRGHPAHAAYEGALQLAHKRKSSFWNRLN